jgi:enoyl-CoA hydratase/carnithine racemase
VSGSANSHAAAVLTDLLRAIEGEPVEQALVAESLAYGLLQGSAEHAAWLAGRTPIAPLPAGQVLVTRAGGTLSITLDRPLAHNAIDRAMRDDLRAAFDLAALDPEIERVVLTATGKAFCSGADLAEFGTTRDPATAHAIRMVTLPAHAIAACAERLEVQVHGACIGAGLEMAAFARHIVAQPSAWFQLPELAMGLIPGAGGCVSVSRRIGAERTLELVLSGRRISARTALDWGLIDAITL